MYLSDFFKKNRTSNYDALSRVRESNDIAHWIKFFLNAVFKTSVHGKETLNRIFTLKNETDEKIIAMGRKSENARKLITLLYRKPAINVKYIMEQLVLDKRAARSIISTFEKAGVLVEITGFKRNRVFEFKRYIALF
ncbi:MAG: hypothetical protein A2Y62_07585 [Candidatus Fischerbacteria bacterium RBG_13_37_8]|uniref:Uncharacterized protein n=1 Tax=Candidatus Fischerbacteria bacterium RBG_13_37_8 TaxID=1817863 RepID=A0A1F5VJL7_9BACT|nr:MAG: hypothetical protein A2Y62_07585 [Candidatus Fischerbacteria bacterium RBG_13_37_8]